MSDAAEVSRGRAASALVRSPAVVIAAVCCGLPLAWMVGAVFLNTDAWAELAMTRWRAGLLARTLGFNAAAGVLATLMGLPAGLVLGRGRGWLARVLWVVLPAALLMPSLSYAYGWSQFVHIVERWTRATRFPLAIEPGGAADTARCIWTLAAWLWAVPAGLVGLGLRRMDTDVQQQAVLDGRLLRITLRQLLGPVLASVAVVTVLATQEFAVYEPTGISVVATEVRMVFDTGSVSSVNNAITATGVGGGGRTSPDQAARAAAAVATTLPLLACTVTLAVLAVGAVARAGPGDAPTVGPWPRVLDAPQWAAAVTVALVAVNVGLPVWSLVHRLAQPFSPGRMWAEFGPQVGGAITVAAVAAGVAVVYAFSAAGRWTPGLLAAAAAAFLIGGQLLAIALIRIYNRRFPGLDHAAGWLATHTTPRRWGLAGVVGRVGDVDDWAYNGWPVPVLAYVGRFGWLALVAARSTWSRPWRELRDMAALDGAGPVATAAAVVWPLAWPTLVAGGLLVGALSLTEVPATVLLFPMNPQVLTPSLMTWLHMVRYDAMIDASLLMMMSVLVPALAAVALVAVGRRLTRFRTAPAALTATATVAVVGLVLLTAGGCGRRDSTPDAVWLETGAGPGQVVYPRGLVHDPIDDSLFVVDRMARVQHLTRDGQFIAGWRMPDNQHGKPVGIGVGPDGDVYVPDTHYYRVIVFTPDGHEVRRWGEFGTGPGQFIYPTDVAFDDRGHVFVTEYGDHDRVQVFDPTGKYLYEFGTFGTGDGQMSRPQEMVVDGTTVYLTDACNHRIDVFTTAGKWVRNFGSCGSALGQFRFPYGMADDGRGHLVVSEFGNNRVQLVDKATGRGLQTWGAAGREPGQLAYPWGVAVEKGGRIVAVDAGNNRLQAFTF